eukprot:scaffold223019_cov32-Tisochrysis_lutea.AAC.3
MSGLLPRSAPSRRAGGNITRESSQPDWAPSLLTSRASRVTRCPSCWSYVRSLRRHTQKRQGYSEERSSPTHVLWAAHEGVIRR